MGEGTAWCCRMQSFISDDRAGRYGSARPPSFGRCRWPSLLGSSNGRRRGPVPATPALLDAGRPALVCGRPGGAIGGGARRISRRRIRHGPSDGACGSASSMLGLSGRCRRNRAARTAGRSVSARPAIRRTPCVLDEGITVVVARQRPASRGFPPAPASLRGPARHHAGQRCIASDDRGPPARGWDGDGTAPGWQQQRQRCSVRRAGGLGLGRAVGVLAGGEGVRRAVWGAHEKNDAQQHNLQLAESRLVRATAAMFSTSPAASSTCP